MNVKQPQLVYSSVPDDQLPLLSIVTLCYNTGRFVVEHDSHVAPDHGSVEHVILDDGSGDDSVGLLVDLRTRTDTPFGFMPTLKIVASPRASREFSSLQGGSLQDVRTISFSQSELTTTCG